VAILREEKMKVHCFRIFLISSVCFSIGFAQDAPARKSSANNYASASQAQGDVLAISKGGTGTPSLTSGRCVQVSSDGLKLVTSSQGCDSTTWGSVFGNLSDQSDLRNALDSKADESSVLHNSGDESVTGMKSFQFLTVQPVAGDDGGFAIKGRWWSRLQGFGVPYIVPTGVSPDQHVAFDLLSKGAPANDPIFGMNWIDVTDTNEERLAVDDCESVRVGKHLNGYGYISVDSPTCTGTNTKMRPLVLQSYGGNVGVGTSTPADLLEVNGSLRAKAVCLGAGLCWTSGAGAPSGTCRSGSLYTDTDLGTLYICQSTLWIAK
jgi:hypothetical protein